MPLLVGEQAIEVDKSSNLRPQGQGVTIWFELRTQVRFRFPPPSIKDPDPYPVGIFFEFPNGDNHLRAQPRERRTPEIPVFPAKTSRNLEKSLFFSRSLASVREVVAMKINNLEGQGCGW